MSFVFIDGRFIESKFPCRPYMIVIFMQFWIYGILFTCRPYTIVIFMQFWICGILFYYPFSTSSSILKCISIPFLKSFLWTAVCNYKRCNKLSCRFQSLFTWWLTLRESVRFRKFSGPYFLAVGLNTEIYGISLRIQPECGKIRTRKTLNTETFHAAWITGIFRVNFVKPM